jgi:hypothetical protein
MTRSQVAWFGAWMFSGGVLAGFVAGIVIGTWFWG